MKAGFGTDLLRRLGTAAVALPLLIAALFWGPPILIVAVITIAVALGFHEFLGMARTAGSAPFVVTGWVMLALVFLPYVAPALGAGLHAGALLSASWPLVALILFTVVLSRARDLKASAPGAAITLLGVLWLGVLGGCLAGLRLQPTPDRGAWRIALLLAVIMGADVLAYFAGSFLGRHKLAPAVSPGKTIEGGIGGVLGGVLGALAIRSLGLPELPIPHAIALGGVTAAVGIVGDLAESLMKRWAGVKDSGALFPGHGGMLDRLDSLLFGAAVLYHYFLFVR